MQIDRFDICSFDRASLSAAEYAALKDRLARQAGVARSRAIFAAFTYVARGVLRLASPHPAAKHVRTRACGSSQPMRAS